MLVLDFVRRTTRRCPELEVHHFHAGHLGLVPGTGVYVGLPFPDAPEVLVTPLHSSHSDLAVLSATIKDDIGVVRDLVDLVSAFGFNVEVQESSSIDADDWHHVHLIIDLSRVEREKDTPARIRHVYGRWKANIPTHDLRFVDLFTVVVERFGKRIKWRRILDRWVPDLTILPLAPRELEYPDRTVVEKRRRDKKHVFVPLGDVGEKLPKLIGERKAQHEHMHYVYLSDTTQRNLRAYFLSSERAARTIQLGFRHRDEPGELAKILDVVARAEFSIVTSLLRKHSPPNDPEDDVGESLLEAILEYKGTRHHVPNINDFDDPKSDYRDDVVPWARDRLREAAARARGLESGEISVGAPLYPGKYGGSDKAFEPLIWKPKRPSPSAPSRRSQEAMPQSGAIEEQKALDRTIGAYRARLEERRVFLSCPKNAWKFVRELKERLDDHEDYDPLVYEGGTGRAQTPAIVEMVRESDYFIGIWHPEWTGKGKRVPTLTPWMPFEFGVAFARGIPRLLVVHKAVPKKVWDRIDKDTDRMFYEDHEFIPAMIPRILAYCEREFP